MEMTCPKCHGAMRTYERNGVHVDQCTDCRGIFLDRGELERLVDAETSWHERPPATSSGGPSHGSQPGSSYGAPASSAGLGAVVNEVISQVRGGRSSSYGHGSSKKHKQSFLGELFG